MYLYCLGQAPDSSLRAGTGDVPAPQVQLVTGGGEALKMLTQCWCLKSILHCSALGSLQSGGQRVAEQHVPEHH